MPTLWSNNFIYQLNLEKKCPHKLIFCYKAIATTQFFQTNIECDGLLDLFEYDVYERIRPELAI